MISATEISAWAYCAEQWRLQYGLSLLSSNQAEFELAIRHHARNTLAERVASVSFQLGRLLFVLAVVVLLLFVRLWL